MKLLKTLLISGSWLLLASCAGTGMPQKPSIDIGVIDYPRSQVIENNTSKMSMSVTAGKISVRSVANGILAARSSKRVPLSTYDKAVALKPKTWEVVQNYIDELVAYAKNGCK